MKQIGINDSVNSNSMLIFKSTDGSHEITYDLFGSWMSILEKHLNFEIPEYFSGISEIGLLPYIERRLNCEEKNKNLLRTFRPKDSASIQWKNDSDKLAVSYYNGVLVFEKVYFDFMDERHESLLNLLIQPCDCDILLINCKLKNKIYRNGVFFEKYLDGIDFEDYGIEDAEHFKLLDKFDSNLEKDLDSFLQNFDYQEDKRVFDVCSVECDYKKHFDFLNSY